jgi:flagellar hook-associated protein 2
VQHTDAAMDMAGSFYVNTGGSVARIDVLATDSMEDIQRKLQFATSINGTATSNGTTSAIAGRADMGLDVTLENGQLVIKRPSATESTQTLNDTFTRGSGSYEYLKYVPDSTDPINGQLTITSGGTSTDENGNTIYEYTYTEGVDYRINSFENSSGVMESRLEWIVGGKSPSVGATYNASYTYNPSAVSFTLAGSTYSTAVYNLDFLDLHYDAGKVQLSAYGIATEDLDFGKSGILEFDSDAFFQAIIDDSQQVANVMIPFINGLDDFIDNLASSAQVTVGGAIITKGRINAAMNNIDTEVASLQEQIDKLESQLAQRQTTMYKQYSNMELAIQKLNAQMSSVSQYLSMNTNSSSS